MKIIKVFFEFYKRSLLLTLLIPFLLLLFTKNTFLAFITCISLSIFSWFFSTYLDDPKRKKLIFFFNFGFSEIQLYGFSFIINIILLLLSLKIIK